MPDESASGNVTVIAHKSLDSPSIAYRFAPNISGNVYSGGTQSAGNTNTITQHEVAVNARWDNAENQAEVLDAAQQVATALASIEEFIDRNPSATWTWDGRTFSSSELRSEIDKTQFVVTDKTTFENGGVGSSQHGSGGQPNVDILSAHSFASTNPQGYAAAGYQGQGVIAMMLHELGHLTDAGFAETTSNFRTNSLDHGTNSPYDFSEYWQNNENFAHDFQSSASTALGINVSIYENTVADFYGAWQPAREIYDWHHGIA